jgi:hypothetical protein
METVSLSTRGYTVLKRWIEAKFDSTIERAKEATDDVLSEINLIFNRKWKIELAYSLPYHEDGCENENEERLHYGDTCDKCEIDEMVFVINLRYNHEGSFGYSSTLLEHKRFSFDHVEKEMLLRWLGGVEKKNKWTFCRCGQLATMNEACESCYIHSYVRSEEEGGDCCICHENDGRWVKLQCGHILHRHCFLKIGRGDLQKCPLCRQQSSLIHSKQDCYDV